MFKLIRTCIFLSVIFMSFTLFASEYGALNEAEAKKLQSATDKSYGQLIVIKHDHLPHISVFRVTGSSLKKDEYYGGVEVSGRKLYFGMVDSSFENGELLINSPLFKYLPIEIRYSPGESYRGSDFKEVIKPNSTYIQVNKNEFINLESYVFKKQTTPKLNTSDESRIIRFTESLYKYFGKPIIAYGRYDNPHFWAVYALGDENFPAPPEDVDVPMIPSKSIPLPSFDCKKAKTEIELTVCSDKQLSKMDGYLSIVYKAVRAQMRIDMHIEEAFNDKHFIESQKKWIDKRNTECNMDSPLYCLRAEYLKRLDELQSPNLINNMLWVDETNG